MYYKYKGQLYGKDENKEMHNDREHPPEPLFTLEETLEYGQTVSRKLLDGDILNSKKYFKKKFNITI